jgi:branched-chain amino acid transport system ATP-binding protein
LLSVRGLSVDYGSGPVLRNVSVHVERGRIVSIVGANGAGKTSLINAISGLAPSRGSVVLEGKDLAGIPAFRRVTLGVVQVPEGRELFPKMSVHENLLMGASCVASRTVVPTTLAETLELFPVLASRLHQAAGSLSGGEQQMVALGRALMARPRLLMLDEPSLGLAPVMVATMFRIIAGLRERGMTILLVEQNVRMSLNICDFAYVLENGAIVREGEGRVLLEDEDTKTSYFGLSVAAGARPAAASGSF